MDEEHLPSGLQRLKNHIDIIRVPFSDRGSRLLIFKYNDRPQLYLKLAERLTTLNPGLVAYRQRPPLISDITLIGEAGEALDFELTTYPHALYFHTRLGDFILAFKNNHALAMGLPDHRHVGLRFHVANQFWQETEQGGAMKSIRNLIYTGSGQTLRNRILPEEGGYTVEFVLETGTNHEITLTIGSPPENEPEVEPFTAILERAATRWAAWFNQTPIVAEKYRRTYDYAWWIMGNNLISPQGLIGYEAMMPSKITYVGLWLWDSALHALAYRHTDPEMARNQIRTMLAHQLPDGMLPDAIYDEGVVSSLDYPFRAVVTKPPILAWAAVKLEETCPDMEFLREIYYPMMRLNAWWFTMNDDDVDGLVQYNHPYSSGLDDSPLWDYGMPIESPDISTYLCIQMESLAQIAEKLGHQAEAAMWRRRTEAIVERMIAHFWDDEAGVFRATVNHQPVPVITPFNLYPLWTGRLPIAIRDRLVAHLTNPLEFGGPVTIPTVARNDPHYTPNVMWRGPVWANINYFFIEALRLSGLPEEARRLRDQTLELIMASPSIYEYYDAETGQPPQNAADIFGWTAAVFIDLAIEASRELRDEETAPPPQECRP